MVCYRCHPDATEALAALAQQTPAPGISLIALRQQIADRLNTDLDPHEQVTPLELGRTYLAMILVACPELALEVYTRMDPREWADLDDELEAVAHLLAPDVCTLRRAIVRRARVDPSAWGKRVWFEFVEGRTDHAS